MQGSGQSQGDPVRSSETPIDLNDARAQHQRGHVEEAARVYEAALVQDPERPDALYLLGVVALQRGDLERAGVLMGKAVAVQPEEPDHHVGLAEVYRALGQPDRAVACCREALRLRPDSAAVHCSLGHLLWLRGAGAEAVANLGTAVRLDPRNGAAWGMLGKIFLEQGELNAALTHCREAVRVRPDAAAPYITLGNTYLVLGRLDEAAACFRDAIRVCPTLAPAHAGLAEVQEQYGDLTAALESRREALRHDPYHTESLAQLATRLGNELPDADRRVMEGLLAQPGLPPVRRWPLLFGLGHVCDARGEYERAAALAAEANALQLADLQRRGRGYDPRVFAASVDQFIAGCTPEFFARVRGWGVDTARPVFIVGLPRSGTTLVEQILATHPRVFGAGEPRLARQTVHALPEVTGRSGSLQECLDHLDRDGLQRLAHRYLDGLSALNGSADRVVDKMPENYLYLGLIAALFPRGKLIHCRRDTRDVALSCWLNHFGQLRWACDPEHIASRIAEYQRVMDHWRRALPVPLLEIDYEAVVADLEPVARKLVAWCDLEWDPACLEFYKTRRPVQNVSVAQVRRPIYHSSVGRWKNYGRWLGPLFAKLGGHA